jgi:sigma-B regulation protein RsbU (phosphoserine phosphatase)
MSTPFPPPLTTVPVVPLLHPESELDGSAAVHADGLADVADWTAAKVLVEHLFARSSNEIAGVDYAVGYRLAHGLTGGDIADVYHFDNGAVSFSIADISGKGSQAAVHAALVKYGLRAYASQGLTAEHVLRSLDRLYLENAAFERIESFASVFFGVVDATRRSLSYASGGHEAAALLVPGEPARLLAPTAPLIGVFDDQHHLFRQLHVELPPGALLVATTDGVTESRSDNGEFFGVEGFLSTAAEFAEAPPQTIVEELIARAAAHAGNRGLRDDVAVLAARFP